MKNQIKFLIGLLSLSNLKMKEMLTVLVLFEQASLFDSFFDDSSMKINGCVLLVLWVWSYFYYWLVILLRSKPAAQRPSLYCNMRCKCYSNIMDSVYMTMRCKWLCNIRDSVYCTMRLKWYIYKNLCMIMRCKWSCNIWITVLAGRFVTSNNFLMHLFYGSIIFRCSLATQWCNLAKFLFLTRTAITAWLPYPIRMSTYEVSNSLALKGGP